MTSDDFDLPSVTNASVIDADQPDAWFDPAPGVVQRLSASLPFAIKTSPPAMAAGLRRAIARARGVDESSVLPGANRSELIRAVLSCTARPAAIDGGPSAAPRVLVLDPMNGDYRDNFAWMVGARVDRFTVDRERCYDVDLGQFAARGASGYDWVMLNNPNGATGRLIRGEVLQRAIIEGPQTTKWWIDETDIDFAAEGESLEAFAAASANVFVCKTLSNAYALSGVGAAYLCGPPSIIRELELSHRPQFVTLPAQVASCEALKAIDYYRARWAETHNLRRELAAELSGLGFTVIPGCANVLLCRLPARLPDAPLLLAELASRGLLITDAARLGVGSDARMVRIAVKDRDTNIAMLEILRGRLSDTFQPKFSLSSPLVHDF